MFTLDLSRDATSSIEFRDVVAALVLPELSWTAEDISVVVTGHSAVPIAEIEEASSTPGVANPVLNSEMFVAFNRAVSQLIDGELIGFPTEHLQQLDKAAIRLDVVDGTFWTVILDPDRVGMRKQFTAMFGGGVPIEAMSSRATESSRVDDD
ncbi:hypothetical protein LQK89_07580 [Curtobacterium sp. C1]|uniref:hypothetical protein n=1 Tax=Curtobacterium sp. C1 TaxID=2898151 RepID=UPI001E61E9E1|nr:hypothetical protein [Curtobacterium sp. C1]UFU15539.1 hypothetical protein LQK89_07580 [Curtobacterium sp. C1]